MPRATRRFATRRGATAPVAPLLLFVASGIEAVPLQPALDLLAQLAELAGDLADVAAMLLEQHHQLIAAGVGFERRRDLEPRGRDLVGKMRRSELCGAGECNRAFERARELAHV